jgi:hypothetical protein
MRYFMTAVLVLGLGVSTWISADSLDKPVAAPVSGKIKWVYDYTEGQTLSRSTGKPMFLVFRCER